MKSLPRYFRTYRTTSRTLTPYWGLIFMAGDCYFRPLPWRITTATLPPAANLTKQRNMEARSRKDCCREQAAFYTKCVLPQLSNMQNGCAVFSSVACPALPYFLSYLINGTITGKK